VKKREKLTEKKKRKEKQIVSGNELEQKKKEIDLVLFVIFFMHLIIC
jgi:hypothetical protein